MSSPSLSVTPTYQGDPAIYFAHQLVDELRGGVLLVPKFQRPASTWSDDQRCLLLESIKRRLPIGSFLLWRTREDLPTRERAGRVTLPHPPQREDRQYVLDGLQRLTCLANAFAPPETLSPPASPEEDNDIRPIFYDLRDERFTVRQGDKPLDQDLPTSALPDTRLLLQALRKLSKLEDADKLSERAEILANTIRSYKVAVIPIVSDNLDDATEAFSRVNSTGTPMNEVHMVTALTYRKDFYLTERLQERLEQLKSCGWDGIDERVVLATIRARTDLDVSDPKPKETSAKIRKNPELLDGAVTAIKRVAELLREPCLVPSPYWVPYAYQTVFLADALWDIEFADLTQAARDTLVRAFWITAYARTFIGRRTRQEKDLLKTLRSIAQAKTTEFGVAKDSIVEPLPDRFDFSSARTKLVALRMAARSPFAMNGEPLPVLALLQNSESRCMQPLVAPRLGKTPGNSILYPPERWLGDSYISQFKENLMGQPTFLASALGMSPSEETLNSHFITKEIVGAFQGGPAQEALRLRAKEIAYGWMVEADRS